MDNVNLQAIRESFGRVVYSHKTHEKEAERHSKSASKLKWVNAVLTALTAGTLVGTLITSQRGVAIVGAIAAFFDLLVAFYGLSFNPEATAAQHKQTAKSLWLIREKYIALMADIINEAIGSDQIVLRRDMLTHELSVVYDSAPPTSSEAYMDAQKALKVNEEFTFSDQEINIFLPSALHVIEQKELSK